MGVTTFYSPILELVATINWFLLSLSGSTFACKFEHNVQADHEKAGYANSVSFPQPRKELTAHTGKYLSKIL